MQFVHTRKTREKPTSKAAAMYGVDEELKTKQFMQRANKQFIDTSSLRKAQVLKEMTNQKNKRRTFTRAEDKVFQQVLDGTMSYAELQTRYPDLTTLQLDRKLNKVKKKNLPKQEPQTLDQTVNIIQELHIIQELQIENKRLRDYIRENLRKEMDSLIDSQLEAIAKGGE